MRVTKMLNLKLLLILLLTSLSLSYIYSLSFTKGMNSNQAAFKYDAERDIIYYKGKIYTSNINTLKTSPSIINKTTDKQTIEYIALADKELKIEGEGEEELLTGGRYWLYILFVFCNFI